MSAIFLFFFIRTIMFNDTQLCTVQKKMNIKIYTIFWWWWWWWLSNSALSNLILFIWIYCIYVNEMKFRRCCCSLMILHGRYTSRNIKYRYISIILPFVKDFFFLSQISRDCHPINTMMMMMIALKIEQSSSSSSSSMDDHKNIYEWEFDHLLFQQRRWRWSWCSSECKHNGSKNFVSCSLQWLNIVFFLILSLSLYSKQMYIHKTFFSCFGQDFLSYIYSNGMPELCNFLFIYIEHKYVALQLFRTQISFITFKGSTNQPTKQPTDHYDHL